MDASIPFCYAESYYAEPDDVVRGVIIPSASLMFDDGECDEKDRSSPALITDSKVELRESPDFWQVGQPRELPFGIASCASMTLGRVATKDVLKALLKFFESTIDASIVKLRPEKCWMSAHVFQNDSSCKVKACLFTTSRLQGSGDGLQELVIELRRQGGDSGAFIQTFGTLKSFIHEHFGEVSATHSEEAHPTSCSTSYPKEIRTLDTQIVVADLVDAVVPHQDAIQLSTSPSIQAEGLTTLATLSSKDAMSAAIVCAALAGSRALLTQFVLHPSPILSYPAARLADHVMRYEQLHPGWT